MKKYKFLFIATLFFSFSCAESVDPLDPESYQIYELAGYQPSFSPNREFVPITDSLYVYWFFEDGDFQKRIGDEVANGTFTSEKQDGQEALLLDFENPDSDLIHSCIRGQEYMMLQTDNTLVGTWQACDGPILFFNPVDTPS
ncbi:hypothetical protein [Algoriphagus sediminis]|uniref:Uncharacterized protein n=1 Tax=Algoriphagus sediminis TaxID=3057113 RepID=A0ABT7YBG6_9BACT|nr:hypothetical protein [Algoriphagus sediminis]MDN3203872.1 hypothetical protein [Algoriphagus sediminis]